LWLRIPTVEVRGGHTGGGIAAPIWFDVPIIPQSTDKRTDFIKKIVEMDKEHTNPRVGGARSGAMAAALCGHAGYRIALGL